MGRSSAWNPGDLSYRPLTAPWEPALGLFSFAGAWAPPVEQIECAWAAWEGERAHGALIIERAGTSAMLHGPVVVAPPDAPPEMALEVAGELLAGAVRHAEGAGIDTIVHAPARPGPDMGSPRIPARARADLAQGAPRAARAGPVRLARRLGVVERGGARPGPRPHRKVSGATGTARLVKLVALAGGTGAAKFLRGLGPLVNPRDLSVVVNTGDDARIWGLHVSPDLDTVTYTLAGLIDEEKGWGVRDETFHALDHMARFGEPTWFNLGDRDLATHLHRTRLLAAGKSLSEATGSIARGLGVTARLLPMSDQPVRTRLLGPDGWLDFQEYFVRDKAQVEIREVRYEGAPEALPAPGVIEAIRAARGVIVCPSNPITSIGPILSVPGLREALSQTSATIVAISPIVGTDAVSGPAGRLMAISGLPVSAAGVARAYASWLDLLVFDERDRAQAPDVLERRRVAGDGANHHGKPSGRGRAGPASPRSARMSVFIAVPVKDLTNAKQRLVPVLDPSERRMLARAMLEDVLQALVSARLGSVHVVSTDVEVMDLARQHGAACLVERVNRGHTEAVGLGPAGSARHGSGRVPDHPGRRPVRHCRRGHADARGAAARAWGALRPVAVRIRDQCRAPHPSRHHAAQVRRAFVRQSPRSGAPARSFPGGPRVAGARARHRRARGPGAAPRARSRDPKRGALARLGAPFSPRRSLIVRVPAQVRGHRRRSACRKSAGATTWLA